MKKILMILVCLMAMTVSVNAHNTHYPTYTVDGITYAMNGSCGYDNGVMFYGWKVQKVHKPNDRTIVIPTRVPINEEDRTEFSGEELHVGSIGEEVFTECTSLDSLIITDGISLDLSTNAFKGCRKLEYLYYSNRCYSWHNYAYNGLYCKTLETTDGYAEKPFWSSISSSLEKLIIRGESGRIIATMGLCKKLKTIVCYPTVPPTVDAAHGETYSCEDAKFNSNQWSSITLYVPRESLEKYYFHKIWGEIDNIYAIDEMNNTATSIKTVANDTIKNDVWYALDGTKVDNPKNGVYIKNGKKYVIK